MRHTNCIITNYSYGSYDLRISSRNILKIVLGQWERLDLVLTVNQRKLGSIPSLPTTEEAFEEWMTANCDPPENYSYFQYSNYIIGYQNSKPWAYKGMSVAYYAWAESKWTEHPDKDKLIQAWRDGLAISAKSIQGYEPTWAKHTSAEKCADFMLSFPETIRSLIGLSTYNYKNHTKLPHRT